MKLSTRRGSALLIVLGLLSFVVVSAVAFATYMRYARLPSSYLRRTSASRLLVKAALAEAIERIDASIGNNPYPGVGDAKSRIPRHDNADGALANHNYWRDRVFLGWDPASPDQETQEEVEPSKTISTLNVEALAYVPPPFINDLRYWSRRSVAGKWHSLAFDAGRYAFCALDVSDCFDVNRMEAGAARDSSDMGRITLAHCFENDQHTGSYTVDPSNWDNFMKNYIDPSGNKVPLVSVADLNLAINDKQPNGIISPFVENITSGRQFVPSETGAEAEMVRNMAFITESYSAGTNSTDVLDISLEENQPQFAADSSSDNEKDNEDGLESILTVSSDKFIQHLTKQVSVPRLLPAILYDYLDRDSVPCSLAIPTVERTPMITGLAIAPEVFTIEVKTTTKEIPGLPDPATGKAKDYTRLTVGQLSLNTKMAGRLSVVYPFKNEHGKKPGKFKAQLAATIAFANDFESSANTFFVNQEAKPASQPAKWPTGGAVTEKKLANSKVPSLITLVSDMKDIPLKTPVETEDDAIPSDLTFNFKETQGVSFAAPFENLTLVPPTTTIDNGTFILVEKLDGNKVATGQSEFRSNFSGVDKEFKTVVAGDEGTVFYPVIKVWARIVDENNKVVDLVPACFADDEKPFESLGSVVKSSQQPSAFLFASLTQDQSSLNISADALRAAVENPVVGALPKFSPQGYIAGDPRYNFAPQNWILKNETGSSLGKMWLEENKGLIATGDGDIFMATSDANYLQSIYELALLPDLSGDGVFSKDLSTLNNGYSPNLRTGFQDAPAGKAMWKTLCTPEAFDQMRQMKVTSGTKGFRVNPNTRDVNIMLSALANTPMDWWAASTNEDVKAGLVVDSKVDPNRVVLDLKKNAKYTMSAKGEYISVEHGKMTNGSVQPEASLTTLARRLMQVFADAGVQNKNWEEVFDDLDWESDDQVAGVDIGATLHSVDRTFLHGYWRECFDNRQQLFLIFVRAEPMMMGGGGLGQTPPQLGGRAVALVWRDPNRPTGQAGSSSTNPLPHRTRVLFYRQLD